MAIRRTLRQIKLENLEPRLCLTTTATVVSGSLTVASDAAADLALQQTAADTWTITDAGVPVGTGTFSGVTGNVTVKTSAADDTIDIDLNGQTAPKSLLLQTGDGTNSVNLHGGMIPQILSVKGGAGDDMLTITGITANSLTSISTGNGNNNLTVTDSTFKTLGISTGSGDDTVTLGDGTNAVNVTGAAAVCDNGGPLDDLEVNSGVTLGSLYTSAVNTIALHDGSTVTGGVLVRGGYNVANSLVLEGTVDGSVVFYGSGGIDSVTQSASSSIGGSLIGSTSGGDDLVDLKGSIGNSLYLDTSSGNDSVTLGGQIANRATVFLGSGDDFFELLGSIGIAPATSSRLWLDGGLGNDRVALRAGSEVNGQAIINLGAGDDMLIVDDAASLVSAYFLGGSGNDTYYGTLPRNGVIEKLFETLSTDPSPF